MAKFGLSILLCQKSFSSSRFLLNIGLGENIYYCHFFDNIHFVSSILTKIKISFKPDYSTTEFMLIYVDKVVTA